MTDRLRCALSFRAFQRALTRIVHCDQTVTIGVAWITRLRFGTASRKDSRDVVPIYYAVAVNITGRRTDNCSKRRARSWRCFVAINRRTV